MQSEDRMHTKIRRQYTEDFHYEAGRFVRESARPVAQGARAIGSPAQLWSRWRAQPWQAASQGPPRTGHRLDAEALLRLKREGTRVTQERAC